MRRFLTWKWLLRGAGGFTLLAVVVPLAYRQIEQHRGQSKLAAAVHRLDESEPGWTLADLCAERNGRLPPPEKNSFTVVREVVAALPGEFNKPSPLDDIWKRPSNTLPRPDERQELSRRLAGCDKALAAARRLIDYHEGGRPLTFPEFPLQVDLEETQSVRRVAYLLQHDAAAAAYDGRPADAIHSVRATLNAARAIGDEPSMISQLVRIAVAAVACRSAERVLGLTEPDAGLAELQAELLREAEFPRMYHSFRSERASLHQTCLLLESGDINKFNGATGSTGSGLDDRFSTWAYRARALEDHVLLLDLMTQGVEAGRRPFDEQWAAMNAIPDVGDDGRHVLAGLLMPAAAKVGGSGLRCRGDLLANAAGIACERYRRRFGRWPATLADIPKDILPAVPTDPFTGRPINYRRLPDGVVVYTVGPDGQDDGGAVFADENTGQKQTDFGIRLWDVAHRRAAAPPPEPKEGETGDGEPEVAPPPRERPSRRAP